MKFNTKVVHAGVQPDPCTGAIMTPIYQTSTYIQQSPGKHKGYEYARTQNPTRTALENCLAELENGLHGLCFASGMAAIDTVLKILKPGDEVIASNDLYGGTYRIFTKVFAPMGIKFAFLPLNELSLLNESITENTKLIWIETPSNPLLNIIDIKAVTEIAQKHDCKVVIDNTFATPYIQKPIDLGVDIVVHSVTKYLSGHSDVIMGAVICNDENLFLKLKFLQNACGAVPSPNDCFLVLRGIKTLSLRMREHCSNASILVNFLENHPKVQKVYYPGLASHPNHTIAKKQMNAFGGMVSFELVDDSINKAILVLEKLELFTLAESLGGVESLCGHPATMTHASIPREERMKAGLKDGLIRLSVGIEDVSDLQADLEQALNYV